MKKLIDSKRIMRNNIGARITTWVILDKYNAGITLLKQDSDGNFKPLKTEETINPDDSKTYTPKQKL